MCSTSTAVLPPAYSLAIEDNARMRYEIIENYFKLGLPAPEITIFFVSLHGIGKSLRQFEKNTWTAGINKTPVDSCGLAG